MLKIELEKAVVDRNLRQDPVISTRTAFTCSYKTVNECSVLFYSSLLVLLLRNKQLIIIIIIRHSTAPTKHQTSSYSGL